VRDAGICSPRGTRCRSPPPNPRCNPVRVVGVKGGGSEPVGVGVEVAAGTRRGYPTDKATVKAGGRVVASGVGIDAQGEVEGGEEQRADDGVRARV